MVRKFHDVAEQIIDDLLTSDPVLARWTGDHRVDGQLPDYSETAVQAQAGRLRESADVLHEVDPDVLAPEDAVDLELLSSAVDARFFELTETRDHEWNPLVHNPGTLFHALIAREFAPAEQRLDSAISRLRQVPDALATAETILTGIPQIHAETAIGQIEGTATLIRTELAGLTAAVPARQKEFGAAQAGALAAIDRHVAYLRDRASEPGRDPRLGRPLWEAKLWHSLDSDLTAPVLLDRAQARLGELRAEITELAAELTGESDPRAALQRLAESHPADATIVPLAQASLAAVTAFVRDNGLITLVDDVCEIVEMPEFARGVAVAYCDAPGPLETGDAQTFYAIAPPPSSWTPERAASFYREYNDHMIHNLTVHEAIPGHFLQLARARRFRGSTRTRALCSSGTFVEGWAVYAEEFMAAAGYGGPAVRMQQLKLQLRMTINAILDQLVHCEDLAEADGMALMTGEGFQEDGEAAG
jgi:uncharacterized protein (DUF885 family)